MNQPLNQQLIYDLIVVGAGPAGMTASVYASRYKLKNLVIGKSLGGELSLAHNVCNFPGFESIPGLELMEKMKVQVEKLGAEVMMKEVSKIVINRIALSSATNYDPVFKSRAKDSNQSSSLRRDAVNVKTLSNLSPQRAMANTNNMQSPRKSEQSYFKVYINDNEIYESKAVIVATGSERRRLNIPGEKEYLGKGVSYCTACDVTLFRNKTVGLIGGSDAAVSGAIHTADYASKVYLIYRGEQLRAEPVWVEDWKRVEQSGKGVTIYKTNITEVLGDSVKVSGVKLDHPYQGKDILALDGVFIEIGGIPGTSLIESLGVKLDETGHVVVDDSMEVGISGLFCAGDMTSKSAKFKQAVTACAQGAVAAASAYKFIKNQAAPRQLGV